MTDGTAPGPRLPPCTAHPDTEAMARCRSCERWLCDTCWHARVDGVAWCQDCVERIGNQRDPLPLAFGITWVGAGLTLPFLAERVGWLDQATAVLTALAAAGIGVVLVVRAMQGKRTLVSPRVAPRTPDSSAPDASGRRLPDVARRLTRKLVAPVSGRGTVILLLVCFLASATLLPWSLRLSPWIEAELALGACAVALATTLTTLLYLGARIADDHFYRAPELRSPWARSDKSGEPGTIDPTASFDAADGCSGCVDAEGCGAALVVAGALVVLALAAFVLAELVFPFLFIVVYAVIRAAVARVANDDHDCAGNLPRSLLWGTAWSLLYVLPLAAAVWLVYLLHGR